MGRWGGRRVGGGRGEGRRGGRVLEGVDVCVVSSMAVERKGEEGGGREEEGGCW